MRRGISSYPSQAVSWTSSQPLSSARSVINRTVLSNGNGHVGIVGLEVGDAGRGRFSGKIDDAPAAELRRHPCQATAVVAGGGGGEDEVFELAARRRRSQLSEIEGFGSKTKALGYQPCGGVGSPQPLEGFESEPMRLILYP